MKALVSLFVCSILAAGCAKHESPEEIAREQYRQDVPFAAEHVPPLKEFVDRYHTQNGRLPTKDEFTAWVRTNRRYAAVWFFPERPYFAKSWGKEGVDYCFAIWRGEDVMFWQSWDQRTFRRATPD